MTKKAIIDWIPTEMGGRRRLPLGVGEPPYAGDAKFDLSAEGPPIVVWSLVVRKIRLLDSPLQWLADIAFLVQEAPHSFLVEGAEFEIYEGKRRVAKGKIVREIDVLQPREAIP